MILIGFLAVPIPSNSESQKTIPMVDCEISGFGLGGSIDQMRAIFGEPELYSIAKPPSDEYPHRDYHYDGLRIVFSMHGRSAMSYFVTSPEYRLPSGVGIGSTWAEIVEALGPGRSLRSQDSLDFTYRVIGADGRHTPAFLTFRLAGDVVTEFSVITR